MYGCDCEGPVPPFEGGEPSDPAAKHALAVLKQCETIIGDKPPTCPWRSWDEPIVADVVLGAYRSCASEMGVNAIAFRQTNPPRYVWQGLQHYAASLNAIRDWDDQQREKNKPRAR